MGNSDNLNKLLFMETKSIVKLMVSMAIVGAIYFLGVLVMATIMMLGYDITESYLMWGVFAIMVIATFAWGVYAVYLMFIEPFTKKSS